MIKALCLAVALNVIGFTTGVAQEPEAEAPDPAPLFTSNDVLELTIEAPLNTIFKERSQESDYHPSVLRYQVPGGDQVSLDVNIKTRGKFRLKRSTCNFPPLRLNFRRGQVENTVFAGQNRLKLVTHCQDGRSEYEQYVLEEYLIYRIYNLFTEKSFQARLARITYVDTDEDRDTLTRYAFFIEDEDAMAERNGVANLEVPVVPPYAYDQEHLNLVEVIQYLIGNTDWDAFQRPPDEEACCHNVRVIGDPAGPVFPVPYDFDFSGIIATRYAVPSDQLPVRLRSVRNRLYRGICRPQEDLYATLRRMNEYNTAITSLYENQPDLDQERRERALEYIAEFYETINDSGKVRREFERHCREPGG